MHELSKVFRFAILIVSIGVAQSAAADEK